LGLDEPSAGTLVLSISGFETDSDGVEAIREGVCASNGGSAINVPVPSNSVIWNPRTVAFSRIINEADQVNLNLLDNSTRSVVDVEGVVISLDKRVIVVDFTTRSSANSVSRSHVVVVGSAHGNWVHELTSEG
jgi:hypothetical protein